MNNLKKLLSVISAAGLLAVHTMPAAALPSQAAETALSEEDIALLHKWGTTDEEIAQILANSAKDNTTQLNCYYCEISSTMNHEPSRPHMRIETVCHPAEVTFFDTIMTYKNITGEVKTDLSVNALSLPATGINGESLVSDSFSYTFGGSNKLGSILYTAPKGSKWKQTIPSKSGFIHAPVLAGDINQDNKVDITDLILYAKYIKDYNGRPDGLCHEAFTITQNRGELYDAGIDVVKLDYSLMEQYVKGEIDCFWTKKKEPVIPSAPSIQPANTVTDFRRQLEAASLDTDTYLGDVLQNNKEAKISTEITPTSYRYYLYDTQDETGSLTEKRMILQDGVTTVQQRLNNTDYLLRLHPVDLAVNEHKACTAVQETLYDPNTKRSVTNWKTYNFLTNGGPIGPAFFGDPETDDGYYEVYYIRLHYDWFAKENPDATARIIDVIPHGSFIGKPKEEIVPPTEIDGYPVEEILPGAYGQLLHMPDSTGTKTQLVYYDPFSEEEPFVLDEEVHFGSGDTDGSGTFSVGDAVYCARIIAEDKTLQITDAGLAAADMDANNFVDVDDLMLMLKLLA